MNTRAKVIVALLSPLLICSASLAQEILYDVRFSTPDQALNQVVTAGSGPDHLTYIYSGSPTVVSTFGPLTNQPLVFNNHQTLGFGYFYSQIGFSLQGKRSPSLELSFDFVDMGANHFFTLHFDTPNVRNFRFDRGGIFFDNPTLPSEQIGTYQLGVAYHFNILLDNNLSRWRFNVNNNLLAEGFFDPVDYVRSIRFNDSATASIAGTAIDNVVVTIPEPTCVGWCGLALLYLNRHRRIKRA